MKSTCVPYGIPSGVMDPGDSTVNSVDVGTEKDFGSEIDFARRKIFAILPYCIYVQPFFGTGTVKVGNFDLGR
jgi:hypothetical protein